MISQCTGVSLPKIKRIYGQGNIPVYKIRWGGTNNLVKIRTWLYSGADITMLSKQEKFYKIKSGDRIAAAKAGGLSTQFYVF